MPETLLNIQNLSISFKDNKVLNNVNIHVPKGKVVAVVGESGSGKSLTSLSVLGLLPRNATVQGDIDFIKKQKIIRLTDLGKEELQQLRGDNIAMIFQEPMTSLNPVITCGAQVAEALILHRKLSRAAAKKITIRLFDEVRLPDPQKLYNRYPHEISGGQKQRVMIAMAMSCHPDLLICDEPTTALDVSVQKEILSLIKKLQEAHGMSVIFISHDLNLVAEIADYITVLYKGNIVEQDTAKNIFTQPQHAYTKALLACQPQLYDKTQRLPVVADFLEEQEVHIKQAQPLPVSDEVVLSVRNVSVRYPVKKSITGKVLQYNNAVNNISFDVCKNETLGLVGGSGCGKTTLGRAIIGLVKPYTGEIFFNGENLLEKSAAQQKTCSKDIQFIFQDPYSSLNPRIKIGDAIAEPLLLNKVYTKSSVKNVVKDWLYKVGLPPAFYDRYPHEFSGGQRQRIVIARALALQPSFVICDESVSALDVSVQAQVLNLLNDLKRELGFTAIFISHDLAVVKYVADRIVVMNKGNMEEIGKTEDVYFHPRSSYTKMLLDALPQPNF
ncbi:ABC transporter ATP-binding protein [Haoranjiania flava]|uniref:ABC transporter ATP-binding protein n=1 Tax=Haoranjiania flava TaxID=1856322 RepID=A0AAE3IMJ8_9BACT|nr:ABC transporter ATP-binding protein [Haoranjiania flava]MCU7693076.1 ABC transporter ATP-binding protein [Haoranjiania flava]